MGVMTDIKGASITSIRFFLPLQGVVDSLEGYFNVEKEAPVFEIENIVLHPINDIAFSFNLATKTTYLCQSSNSGFYKVAHHKFVYSFGIHMGMANHMRAGAHNRHFTF